MRHAGIVTIRVDSDERIGSGHVMRCLALAQEWRKAGGQAVFFASRTAPAIRKRVWAEGFELRDISAPAGTAADARETADFAHHSGSNWVVVDGYDFDSGYRQIIKASGVYLLTIDDCGQDERYVADLILNQNIHASDRLYSKRESYSQLLLGPRFALIRSEFLECRGWRRAVSNRAEKLLVTLGGGDTTSVTLAVIEALGALKALGFEARVVVGPMNPNYEQILDATRLFEVSIALERNVVDMCQLMKWADVAISAGGSTCWELAFMGLPSLIVVLADNQHDIARGMDKEGAGRDMGASTEGFSKRIGDTLAAILDDREGRRQMSAAGRSLVDGAGAARVCEQMRGLASWRAGATL